MMINTVTFDLWNTLLVHESYDDMLKNARIDAIVKALENAKIIMDRQDIIKAYDSTEISLIEIWGREIDISIDDYVELLLNALNVPASNGLKEMVAGPYSSVLLDFCPSLVDGTKELLEDLKEKGYRIGIISNVGRTPGRIMRLVLDRYGLCGYFDSMTFSDEVRYIKPNRKIFEISLKELDSKPDETVHVGDNRLLDIYGAKSIGMKAILFNKYSEKFEKYAEKYYHANGRYADPDEVVSSLLEVKCSLEKLGGL